MTGSRVALDTQVKATLGNGKTVEGRVYRISPFGWVAIVDADGNQWVAPEGYEVTDDPRPVAARRNIPSRLQ